MTRCERVQTENRDASRSGRIARNNRINVSTPGSFTYHHLCEVAGFKVGQTKYLRPSSDFPPIFLRFLQNPTI
jgi:hypothetical protein